MRRDFERLASFGTWERDLTTGDSAWSEGTYRVLGLPSSDPARLATFRSLLHPQDIGRYLSVIRALEEDGTPFTINLRIIRPDGQTRRLLAIGYRIGQSADRGPRLVGAVQDVTRLHDLQADRAALLQRTLEVADDERRRIAGRLHDDVAQELYIALLRVAAVAGQLDDEQLEQVQAPIATAAEQLRAILADVDPPDVTAATFQASLATYAARVLGDAPSLDLQVETVEEASPTTLAMALRILREALSNTGRHACATHVAVSVHRDGRDLVGRVEDDGTGFDTTSTSRPEGHLGLRLMHERTEDLGGTLEIRSSEGAGTTVTCRLPLDPMAAP